MKDFILTAPYPLAQAALPVVEQLESRAYFSIPTAPIDLGATATGPTAVSVSWSDQSSNETGFKIERSTAGGSYSQVATVGANVTSYNNTSLSASTHYDYRVRAYNADGNTAYTNIAGATTADAPAAPSSLTSTPVSGSKIGLSWTNNDGGTATNYKVERSSDGGSTYSVIATLGAGVSTYTATGLSISTTYSFRVRAYNGAYSGYSNVTTNTTTAGILAPSDLTATATSTTHIDLAWTNNVGDPATANKVELSVDGGTNYVLFASVGPSVNALAISNLSPSLTYTFRVRAYNGVYSGYSNVASVTPPAASAAPSDLLVTSASTSSLNLSWHDNASDETGYLIQKRQSNGSWVDLTTVAADATTYTVTGLSNGAAVTYRVFATNANGNSLASNAAAAKTGDPGPGTGTYLVTLSGISMDAGSALTVDDSLTLVNGGMVTAANPYEALANAITGHVVAEAIPGAAYNYGQNQTFDWGTGAFKTTSMTVDANGVYSGSITLEDTFGWSGTDSDYNDDSWAVTVQYVPTVTVSAPATAANEAGPVAQVFTFTRTGSTAQAMIAQYSLGGDATIDADYTVTGDDTSSPTATSRQITFATGSSTATVTITPKVDALAEATEHVTAVVQARLSSSDPLYVPNGTATIDILDA